MLLLFGNTISKNLIPAMIETNESIDHITLTRMHAAGVVTDALLVAEPQGWACVVQVRRTQYPLVAKRGGVRHWAKMESAARYLQKLGIAEFRVDARNLDAAAAVKTTRPDASSKLKAAHEAAAYDAWFREQVQIGLDEADSPDAVWYTHDEVMAEAEARLEARIAKAKTRAG